MPKSPFSVLTPLFVQGQTQIGKSALAESTAEKVGLDQEALSVDVGEMSSDVGFPMGHPDGFLGFGDESALFDGAWDSQQPFFSLTANGEIAEHTETPNELRARWAKFKPIALKPLQASEVKDVMRQLIEAHASKAGITISISEGALDLLVDASADSLRKAVNTMRRALPGSDASAESSSWHIEASSSGDRPGLKAVPSS